VKDPDMVFIMSGINSMAMGYEGIADIYRKVVQEVRQAYPSAKIIVQSLLPVLFPLISNEDIRHMNTRLKHVAADEKALYLDIHSRFLDEKGRPMAAFLMDDGVHVSGAGYHIWANEVARFIKT
jgi:lysophospholipase L1-like esterase